MNPHSTYVPASEQEAAFLAAYDPSKYARNEVSVDVVILTVLNGKLCVLLVQRGGYPYKGQWALPGGFAEDGETLEQAARRELLEESGLQSVQGHLEQLGTYGDPGRDPRARVISVTYLALLPQVGIPTYGSDADDARFWPIDDMAEAGIRLAFDHDTILTDALDRAASKLEYTPLATAFCGKEFTLGELRRVFEAVWDTKLNPANFRRWALTRPGFVVATGNKAERNTATGLRSSELYRAGDATLLHPPMLRPAAREKVASSLIDLTPGA